MKITVGKKIGAGFLLAAAAIAIIGVASYRSTLKLVETAGWVAQTEDVLKNLEATISAAKDLETGRRGYVITGDEAFLEPYDAALARLDGLMGTLRLLIEDSGEQRRLSAIEPLIEESKRISKEIIDARKTVGFEAGQKLVMSGIGKRNMDEIRKRIAETKDGENVLMQTRKADADTAVARTQNMIVLGGSAAVILLAFVGWLITKDIATPLGEVTAAADRIAGGDINFELAEVSRTDEVGTLVQTFRRMCRSLNVLAGRARQIASGDLTARVQPQSQNDVLGNAFASMTDNLRKVIGEVIEAANVLRSSAAEISAATTQIAASASETATAVTQTTATVVEVKQASSSSSQIAEHVSSQAQKVADVSRQGRASVEDVITGMTRIREHMDSIGSSILRLNAQGQTIGEIISTVDELAGQSKMLAINASMEAAKAGEEGKGFAVVAQEVKNLAEQSRLATDRVRTILHEIEKATSTAVLTTEQGSKAVDAGLRQSSAAGDSITALSDSVTESAHSSSQIAVSSHQQSVGMDQVSLAMDNIQNASAKTAAGARQAESEAQRLVVLGRKLGELVAAFKV
ncbi:MAG: CHASE3 domain-containing protein [Chthoniobacteraceae bacterium]